MLGVRRATIKMPKMPLVFNHNHAWEYPSEVYSALAQDCPHLVVQASAIEADSYSPAKAKLWLLDYGDVVCEADAQGVYSAVIKDGMGDVHLLRLSRDEQSLIVNTASKFGLNYALWEAASKRWPRPAAVVDHSIYANFWFQTNQGPKLQGRRLEAPEFDYRNYPATVASGLLSTQALEKPEGAGKLILWHGVPGTGKTYAVRGLAWAWREWCTLEYVTDPESFLGNSEYMMNVLLRQEPISREHWKLIVLEDAGELIGYDARSRTGQSFSRLLNVTEGLIGQGLKVLVLITTNEDIGRLNPAAKRPGRCLAELGFESLSALEAAGWCAEQGIPAPERGASLAELYAYRAQGEDFKWPERRAAAGLRHAS